ncbi:hypothetical protein ACOME3_008481 [Neoechinorhynchus agilis]
MLNSEIHQYLAMIDTITDGAIKRMIQEHLPASEHATFVATPTQQRLIIPILCDICADKFPNLLMELLNEPRTLVGRLFEICRDLYFSQYPTLALVDIRFRDFPPFESFFVKNVQSISYLNLIDKIVCIEGTIVGFRPQHVDYIASKAYVCLKCVEDHGNPPTNCLIRFPYFAGDYFDKPSPFKMLICRNCGKRSNFKEDVNKRYTSKYIKCMVLINSTEKTNARTIQRNIIIIVRDELTEEIRIGLNARFVMLPYIYKNSIRADLISVLPVQPSILYTIPSSIELVWKSRRSSSPFSFLFSMAFVLAGDVTPFGSFLKLKLVLLLSLVSDSPIHVVAFGPGLLALADSLIERK